jgi:hypothetical protein
MIDGEKLINLSLISSSFALIKIILQRNHCRLKVWLLYDNWLCLNSKRLFVIQKKKLPVHTDTDAQHLYENDNVHCLLLNIALIQLTLVVWVDEMYQKRVYLFLVMTLRFSHTSQYQTNINIDWKASKINCEKHGDQQSFPIMWSLSMKIKHHDQIIYWLFPD